MNYWILKGHKERFDAPRFEDNFADGITDSWPTRKPLPEFFETGDRAFIWESSPGLRVVCIAEIGNIGVRDSTGETRFDVIYKSSLLAHPIKIARIKKDPSLIDAVFLKGGPVSTIYSISESEAVILIRLVEELNPGYQSGWIENEEHSIPNVPNNPVREYREQILSKLIRDRVSVARLKELYENKCQICSNRIEVLPDQYYSEVHHIWPLSEHGGPDVESNMLVLCPNHHKIFDFAIPVFVDSENVRIGTESYVLCTRHVIDQKNIEYHNNLAHERHAAFSSK